MAVVKIKDKKQLDQLVAKLTLRLGKKIPQQDVLDVCIKLSTNHIDELADYFSPVPKISKERVIQILNMAEDFEESTKGDIDADLYAAD